MALPHMSLGQVVCNRWGKEEWGAAHRTSISARLKGSKTVSSTSIPPSLSTNLLTSSVDNMRWLKRLFIGGMTLAMVGCSATRTPTVYTGLPEQLPVQAPSLYEPYLECLGALLQAKGGPEVDVLIGGFGDTTRPSTSLEAGFIGTDNGPWMARTGLARLAPRVRVITPTASDAERTTLLVKGAFTELDRVPLSYAGALALRIYGIEITGAADRAFDIMTLDIELAQPDGRQLPGLATTLSVLVDSQTQDVYLQLDKGDGNVATSAAGKFKSVSRRHAAQRLLIHMGLYWLFSRHFELDGHACLDDPLTDVEAVQELMRAYRKMSVAEQVRAVQRRLMEKGYDIGPIDGVLGEPTRRAIRQFQARRGDPPTGQMSAPLYLQLSIQRKPGGPPVVFSTMQYQTQRIQTGRGHALP